MIRLVVLNMAGTTVRDDGLVMGAFAEALGEVGVGPGDPRRAAYLDVAHEAIGRSRQEVFRMLFGLESTARAGAAAFERAMVRRVRAGQVRAVPGAGRRLDVLRAAAPSTHLIGALDELPRVLGLDQPVPVRSVH